MRIEHLLKTIGADFYTGVPDSQLKSLCDYLITLYGIDSKHHVIAANEGNAVALAAGYHLATGKVPVVYLQNSGEGNIINPIASLLNKKVYSIPMIFIIGWRGEPGKADEPQHIYQGEITIKILEVMGIETFVIDKETSDTAIDLKMEYFKGQLKKGFNVAFIIKKDALTFDKNVRYNNNYSLLREEVIQHIVKFSGDDPVVSTTGKISRELFEIRENGKQGHEKDFLTVGSMGHSSSIAFGIAVNIPNKKVWCIDGDGAVLMHMGAMAVIGSFRPQNFIHIVINNCAHDTVGGMPTAVDNMDLAALAKSCGYLYAVSVESFEELDKELKSAKEREKLSFIEVKCAMGARKDLGRPTTSSLENKNLFMEYLKLYR